MMSVLIPNDLLSSSLFLSLFYLSLSLSLSLSLALFQLSFLFRLPVSSSTNYQSSKAEDGPRKEEEEQVAEGEMVAVCISLGVCHSDLFFY